MGYDVHRLVPERDLIIGGVKIPYEKGLLGHSDADVLLHAIMDALLGAAALGDIGKHFPDNDPAYKGADSLMLLGRVGEILSEEGYVIENIDSTIIAQKPKMAPHIEQMRKNVAEALQEKKIAQIADTIFHRGENGNRVKLVLIAGPSSSGKTTFSKRLSIQLMTNGLKPFPISLDNYFVDREETPLDENGNYDYESLYALDLELFNQQLQALLRGEEVELPRFNFSLGKKEYKGDKLKIEDNTILILEGIHALNPELTPHIPAERKFKIYVSALTTISLDDHNWIPTTDNRLLRRIIRDFNYRGYSARETISRWPSVRAGEDKWIFPYQENADVMFNSALLFEFAVLRLHAEPILMGVPRNCPEYCEAYRLLKFIKYFVPVQDKEIPPTSLLREFLGGSSFKY